MNKSFKKKVNSNLHINKLVYFCLWFILPFSLISKGEVSSEIKGIQYTNEEIYNIFFKENLEKALIDHIDTYWKGFQKQSRQSYFPEFLTKKDILDLEKSDPNKLKENLCNSVNSNPDIYERLVDVESTNAIAEMFPPRKEYLKAEGLKLDNRFKLICTNNEIPVSHFRMEFGWLLNEQRAFVFFLSGVSTKINTLHDALDDVRRGIKAYPSVYNEIIINYRKNLQQTQNILSPVEAD